MIIVVTGMVGLDKKQYLQEVCVSAKARGRKVALCNVGDMMYAEAPDISPGRILDIPLKRLHLLRRSVFKDIIARSNEAECLIVNTHATFRWHHGLFPAFDFDQMRQLNADMYVCLVGGADMLHVRLAGRGPKHHRLKDLLVWREEEILATQMMRQGVNEDALYYCLARGAGSGTVETFYRLAFEGERSKTYLSFPMTHVADKPEVVEEINRFRDAMRGPFICFDPADVEEAYLPYRARKAMAKGLDYMEVSALGKKVKFSLGEVLDIESDINSQIYARDFALIDQSDMIISFIPELADGSAAVSSGVERELQHAHEAAKEVYVIWPARVRPSVFVTQTATRVFEDTVEALRFFEEKGYSKC
ncbi:MAG TPA: AAA family ATPase [Planctomycetes bacterium]|nr:AAA family ATPase [Planctomycetota bacterium]